MSDTTDEMEAGVGLYENYLEDEFEKFVAREQEERIIKMKVRNESILIRKIDRRIEIAKHECICNQGIHDGKRIDCACKICHN